MRLPWVGRVGAVWRMCSATIGRYIDIGALDKVRAIGVEVALIETLCAIRPNRISGRRECKPSRGQFLHSIATRAVVASLLVCFLTSCGGPSNPGVADTLSQDATSDPVNACGGIGDLNGTPGQLCEGGRLECSGPDSLACQALPAGTTVVIRGEVFDSVSENPLGEVVVTLKGAEGTVPVRSHYDGVYLMPVAGPGRYRLEIAREGWTKSIRIVDVPEGTGGITTAPSVYLTPVDSEVTQIGPNGGTHRNSTGTVEIVVPAGAVTETVPFRVTQYMAGRCLPGALPGRGLFTYSVVLEPNLAFEKAVTLRIKNGQGFAPGASVPVGHFDFDRGEWIAEGVGTISEDGNWAEFQLTGAQTVACYLPAVEPAGDTRPSPNNTTEYRRGSLDEMSGKQRGGSEIGLGDGSLAEAVRLPSVSVLGIPQTLTLTYNSRAAYPTALFGARRQITEASPAMQATSLEIDFAGAHRVAFFAPDKRERTYAVQLELRDVFGDWLPTGSHAYRWRFSDYFGAQYGTASWFGGGAEEGTGIPAPEPLAFFDDLAGRLAFVNLRGSPLGAGWMIGEVSNLALDSTGSAPLLVEGGVGWNDLGLLVDPISGQGFIGGTGDGGPAANATLNQPSGLAVAEDGTLYVVDSGDYRVRRVSVDGTISSFAGTGTPGFSGDGSPAISAELGSSESGPSSVAIGVDGSVFIADPGNFRVRAVRTDGTIETVAGNGDACQASSGKATAVCIGRPQSVAVDRDGTLYIASEGDSAIIYRVSGDQIERIAGLLTGEEPGRPHIARERKLACAREIAVAPDGTVYLSAAGASVPGRIDPSGTYQEFTYQGPWRFAGPLAVDPDGRLVSGCFRAYPASADQGIARLDWAGQTVEVVLGSSPTLAPGDLTVPASEFAFEPKHTTNLSGIAVSSDGIIYFNDGNRIRRIGNGTREWRYPDNSVVSRQTNDTYVRLLGEGGRVFYDASGRETERRDASGNSWVRKYDENGLLTAMLLPDGTQWTIAYDEGRIASIVDPAGRTSTFVVDADGNLVSITMPDQTTSTFGYDERHLLVTKQPAGVESPTVYSYDKTGRIESVVLPTGEVRKYRTQAAAEVMTLDEAKQTSLEKPLPRPTTLPTQQGTYTDGLGNTTRFGYDSTSKTHTKIDPLGRKTEALYGYLDLPVVRIDEAGTEQNLTYDARGNLRSREIPALNALSATEWHPRFDLPVAVTDEVGGMTVYEYDDLGRLLRMTDPEGGVWTYERDDRGLVTRRTDPTTADWSYEYDATGNATAVVDPLGNRTEYMRDSAGNIVQVVDPLGAITTFEYDEGGRLISATDALGTTNQWTWGPFWECSACSPGDAGLLLAQTDALGNTTSFEYNEIGQLLATTDPTGGVAHTKWDLARRPVTSTDPGGATKTRSYDAAGQLVQLTMPDGGKITLSYSAAGFLEAVTDPIGHKITYNRDPLGRLLGKVDPLGNEETYSWDAAGRMVSQKRATGEAVTLTWDHLGRLVQRSATGAGTSTFWYDGTSRLVEANDSDSRLGFEYDAAGHLVGATTGQVGNESVAQPVTEIRYEYDAAGRRSAMVLPDGRALDYRFDGVGRLTEALQGPDSLYSLTWDAAGRRTSLHRGPLSTEYGYDASSRTTAVVTRDALGPLASFEYSLDAVGNPIELRTETGIHTFGYDKAWRLTAAAHGEESTVPDEAYTYDAAGNRLTSAGGTNYTYDAAGRLLSAGTTHYTFDASGRMTSRSDPMGTWSYRWDALDQLLSAEWTPVGSGAPTKQASFRYDALGRRIESTVWPETTRFVYDNNDRVADYDEFGTLKAVNIFGPAIDEPLIIEHPTGDGVVRQYLIADRLGTVVAVLDSEGTMVQRYTYNSFGHGYDDSNGPTYTPFGFTGREMEPAMGLYYFRARWYDASAGVFVSVDPKPDLTQSLYSYASNMPLLYKDPFGESRRRIMDTVKNRVGDYISGELSDAAWKFAQSQMSKEGQKFARRAIGEVLPNMPWMDIAVDLGGMAYRGAHGGPWFDPQTDTMNLSKDLVVLGVTLINPVAGVVVGIGMDILVAQWEASQQR